MCTFIQHVFSAYFVLYRTKLCIAQLQGVQSLHDHHRFVQMLQYFSGRWQFRVLRNGHLFPIFTKAPYQLAAWLVLEDVDTAMSKTQSLSSEILLSSKGNPPANGEWS